GGAIVDLVDPRSADRQRPRRDVGRGAGRGVEAVVAGIGPAEADPRHADRRAAAHVLIGEAGAAVAVAADITTESRLGQADGRSGIAVVDLVDPRSADRQRPCRDVGRGAGRGVLERVVPRIRARDRDTANADRLARAHVLVGEAGAGVAVAEDITPHAVI